MLLWFRFIFGGYCCGCYSIDDTAKQLGGGAVEYGGGLGTRRQAFTCDLWKSVTNKEYFTCTAHWVWPKVGRGLELKQRVVTTCKVLAETISTETK